MTSKQQPTPSKSKLEILKERSRAAEDAGHRTGRETAFAGKMTARERVEFVLDEGTFEEFDKLVVHRSRDFGMDEQLYPGDGVVTGYGLIDSRKVFCLCPGLHYFRRFPFLKRTPRKFAR